jgi:histidine ammonia-lyase
VRTCLAVEVCCAAQGIDLRAGIAAPSAPMQAVHAAVRARVARMDTDREVAGQIAAVSDGLPGLCSAAAAACGGLR